MCSVLYPRSKCHKSLRTLDSWENRWQAWCCTAYTPLGLVVLCPFPLDSLTERLAIGENTHVRIIEYTTIIKSREVVETSLPK
ncbi:hypothetical protein K449DRAFT_199009 [Hypoxylon sp. EC38]|nr:hypothetical protein K449DRAFT_199009 [Hypoxylon sp. EC38]